MEKLLKYDELNEELVEIESNKETIMDTLYKEIECSLVQYVALRHGIIAWVDEEGLMTGNYSKINTVVEEAEQGLRAEHRLVGNIVFSSLDNNDEVICGLNDEQAKYIKSLEIKSQSPEDYLGVKSDYDDGLLG